MLGKLVPQPENQPEYPLEQSVPKSDPVTEGSAPQAELKSGPFSGPRGDDSNISNQLHFHGMIMECLPCTHSLIA